MTMGLLSRACPVFLGAVGLSWREGGIVGAFKLKESPNYCSKDMLPMQLPDLANSVRTSFKGVSEDDVELIQVHALIRHGARTPWTTPKCWKGYDITWNCNVTEIVSPSLSRDDGGVSETGLFRKVYDASPEDNVLLGTCKEGQLLTEGYKQETKNGQFLREAYVCNGSLCLFANNSVEELQDSGALYLRSDDSQRTVMSGQILTAEMFNVSDIIVDWHTNDAELDYISPNERACPRLTELREEALNAPRWMQVMTSSPFGMLNTSLVDVWGRKVVWGDVLDCLMTTACTSDEFSNELPNGMTEDLFKSAVEHATEENVQVASYNNASYGKLGIAKLTAEIRERMDGAINGTSPLKFVLISGHDTTFLALLSAVAPGAWNEDVFPPYATLSTIELLRVGGGEDVAGDYFRFIYNGEVLKLKGCDQDICSIDVFMNATQFALDLEGEEHCCCRNMTQAEVDAAGHGGDDDQKNNSTSLASPAPSSASLSPAMPSPVPTSVPGADAYVVEKSSSSNRTTGLMNSDAASSSSGDSGGAAALGIAVACFFVGAVVGGIPALMYYRSFRYETLRAGGSSYEMT